MLESMVFGEGRDGGIRYRWWLRLALLLGLCIQWSVAEAQNPNPDFRGNSPPGGWQHSINSSTESVLVAEGDVFTLAIDEHAYDFCSESSTDNCITGIRWFWFDRTYSAPFNNGVAWSVELEIVDPDNDCRGGEDYTCTVRVVSVTQNGDFCGYPNLGFITPIIVDYVGEYSPGIPNTSGLPYILSERLYLDLGPADCPPAARIDTEAPDPSQGEDSFTWSFDGSRSNDPDNLDPSTFWIPVGDSEGIVTWIWDFGDGAGGSGPQPSHQYQEPGYYDVTLTVLDDEGDEDQITESIEVTAEIDAAFTYAAEPGDPLTINFDGSASSSPYAEILDWYWSFGDGTDSAQSAVMIQHTYDQPGTYDVDLAVIDDLGNEGEITMSIVVGGSEPTAVATAQPDPNDLLRVGLDGSGSFDADDGTAPGEGIASWSWDLGDGSFSSEASFTHAYPAVGIYPVTLTVYDDEGEAGQTSFDVDLTYEVVAAASSASGTEPNEVLFDGTASTTHPQAEIVDYAWQFGDGSAGSGPSPSHFYTDPGTYTTTLTVTDNYDQVDEVSAQVVVDGQDPVAIATGGLVAPDSANASFDGSTSYDPDDSTNPGDGIVLWQWDFGDGNASSGPSVSHGYDEDGIYTVTLTVTDDEGSTGTTSLTVAVSENSTAYKVTFSGSLFGASSLFEATVRDDGVIEITSQVADPLSNYRDPCSEGSVDLDSCLYEIQDHGVTQLTVKDGSQLSCGGGGGLPDSGRPWCDIPALAEYGDSVADAESRFRQELESYRGLGTPPPGGGLPTYAATRQEARELRPIAREHYRHAAEMSSLMAATRLRTELLQEEVRSARQDQTNPVIVAYGEGDSQRIAAYISVDSTVPPRIGALPNTQLTPVCESVMGSAGQSGCVISQPVGFGGLLDLYGGESSLGLIRRVYRAETNQWARNTRRLTNQVTRRVPDPGDYMGQVIQVPSNRAGRIQAMVGEQVRRADLAQDTRSKIEEMYDEVRASGYVRQTDPRL